MPEAAFDVVLRTFVRAGMADQAVRLQIDAVWAKAVGERIAARTAPQSYSRGRLVVKATSATWQHELMFLRQAIVDKVNAALSRPWIKDLKVISGTLAPRRPSGDPPVRNEPNPSDVASASACAGAIADQEVRAAFTRLMAKDLWHQRQGTLPPSPGEAR